MRWTDDKEDNAVAGSPMLSGEASRPPTKVGSPVAIHPTTVSESPRRRFVRAMGLSGSSSEEDLHSLVVTKRKHPAPPSSAKPNGPATSKVRTVGSGQRQAVKILEKQGGSGGTGPPWGEGADEVLEQEGGGHGLRPY